MVLDCIPETPADVHAYLDRMPMFRKDGAKAANFKLDETRALLAAVGNPHENQRFFHVAGTNGKGSTCAMLASVLYEAGYKTGLYTSPHVVAYNERIKINGVQIPDEALLTFFQENALALRMHEHTYFELSTVLAFWWFARQKTDVAVIEVGLGGRLDATNVIDPLVSVVTSIGLDHVEQLGPTTAHIAAEKSGIIKPAVPVVIGNLDNETAAVVQFHAVVQGAPFLNAAALEPRWENERIVLNTGGMPYRCGLKSVPQAWNAASAWLALEVAQSTLPVPESAFRRGLERVLPNTGLVGRFERLHPDYDWFFDGGHNQEALLESLKTIQKLAAGSEPVLIFSMMRDKVTPEALAPFLQFKEIWYHALYSERAATFAEFAAVAGNARHLDGPETLKSIVHQHHGRCVVFLGSFYFYNTARQWISTC